MKHWGPLALLLTQGQLGEGQGEAERRDDHVGLLWPCLQLLHKLQTQFHDSASDGLLELWTGELCTEAICFLFRCCLSCSCARLCAHRRGLGRWRQSFSWWRSYILQQSMPFRHCNGWHWNSTLCVNRWWCGPLLAYWASVEWGVLRGSFHPESPLHPVRSLEDRTLITAETSAVICP